MIFIAMLDYRSAIHLKESGRLNLKQNPNTQSYLPTFNP